jgi:ABC-type proline/glycine betaine transport system permease subunit
MILYATPLVALIPFILSMMGFGFAPKVLVVFLFSVFPVIYNTVEGARSIKPEMIEVARSFRSSESANSTSAGWSLSMKRPGSRYSRISSAPWLDCQSSYDDCAYVTTIRPS